MIKKTAQIDAILLDLNKSIDAHYQWLVKMFRCVVAKDISHPELSDAHSHFLCRFGQWLNAHLVMTEEEIEYVRLISPAHEEMHLQGRELLTSIAEKRWQSTDFDRFQNTLLAFTSAVMDYKIYLLNIRSNMDILTGLPVDEYLMNPSIASYSTPNQTSFICYCWISIALRVLTIRWGI